jgi:hypothetical protein
MNTTQSGIKTNDIFAIIKSGITGALALTGICIILFIIGLTVRIPFVFEFYSKTLARCSLESLFITTSGLGFILGLIVRRRLPIIQRGIAPIAVAAIPLIFGAWLLDDVGKRISVPQIMKLADCTNSTVIVHFKVPKGHAYHLELITPGVQAMPNGTVTSSYKFSGRIRISNGASMVADLPIGSDKAWLTASCFVLTGVGLQNTNVPPLSKFIQSHKSYNFEISFEPPPPPGSSIWLYCLVSARDQ